MNSVKKGNELEYKLFEFFSTEISEDRFVFKESNCKVFLKKGYYSRDRQKEIIFDIAIEAYFPGEKNFSYLTLIECKNYNHAVPVDDVEEFFAKIQQISGANIKGIVASTNSFQEGTINFSKSKGMGLLRYYDNSDFKWELNRSPSTVVSTEFASREWMNACSGLTTQSHKSERFDFYCYSEGSYTNSLHTFLSNILDLNLSDEYKKIVSKIKNTVSNVQNAVRYLEEEEIEKTTSILLDEIGYVDGSVSIEDLCHLKSDNTILDIVFHDDKNIDLESSNVLGKISFFPLKIEIYENSNSNPERMKFTLAHELGHYYLGHGKYMTGEFCQRDDFELEKSKDLGIQELNRMEWQANYFASCILLPKTTLVSEFYRLANTMEIKNRGHGALYLDNQKCNRDAFYNLSKGLKSIYGVSRAAIKIRLVKLGLVVVGASLV